MMMYQTCLYLGIPLDEVAVAAFLVTAVAEVARVENPQSIEMDTTPMIDARE